MKTVTKEVKAALEEFVREATKPLVDQSAIPTSKMLLYLKGELDLYQVCLPKPKSDMVAEQCREMGLKVGDRIVGRETYRSSVTHPGERWTEARLTIKYLGKKHVVFDVERRSDNKPNWWDDGEQVHWTLKDRDWVLAPILDNKTVKGVSGEHGY